MRTLIYKRTHCGDPDPRTGVFGNNNCMGKVRTWAFDAVIGIGGVSNEPRRKGIAGKLTWIGIGPQKSYDKPNSRSPQVRFRHFKYFGKDGPLLKGAYQYLYEHMYETHRRFSMHSPSSDGGTGLDRDIADILHLASNALSSVDPTKLERRQVRNKCKVRTARRARC